MAFQGSKTDWMVSWNSFDVSYITELVTASIGIEWKLQYGYFNQIELKLKFSRKGIVWDPTIPKHTL